MPLIKPIRKRTQKIIRGTRQFVARKSPKPVKKYLGPIFDYFDMLFFDHGIFRVIYFNKHRIADGVYRSSQPAPHQIRRLAKKGIKTIINLRGPRECGSYRLEEHHCARNGIKLINFVMYSRAAPSPDMIREAEELFKNVEYPILMHCKSGADRAGLASVLHMFLHQNTPIEVAQKQLSLKYGHIRQADTGVLDYFFDLYVEAKQKNNISFYDWLDKEYQPKKVKADFQTNGFMNTLVNKILRRE